MGLGLRIDANCYLYLQRDRTRRMTIFTRESGEWEVDIVWEVKCKLLL